MCHFMVATKAPKIVFIAVAPVALGLSHNFGTAQFILEVRGCLDCLLCYKRIDDT